ncbi:hypothetical protein SDC9_180166 [bioreactor metagenome]|uniref:Uncharacterized protein n=1 Tax=bioreactor metagenome TaxID=1076179 RepID=A0A645H2I5_9ZZZZ
MYSRTILFFFNYSINNDINIMLFIFLKLNLILQRFNFIIHTHPDKTFTLQLLQKVFMCTLLLFDYRGHDHQSRIILIFHNSIQHLFNSLRFNRNIVRWAVRRSYAGVHQT